MPIGIPPFPERRGARYARWMKQELLRKLPRERLENMYYNEKQSTKRIAIECGVSQSCIWNLFKKYELKTRTLQESMVLKRKPATRYKRTRWRALNLLGGRCVHCGCDDIRILEIHHRKGGGGRERHEVGGSGFYYNILMGRRRTDDLEVCCGPCHAVQDIKRVYGVDNFHVEWRDS